MNRSAPIALALAIVVLAGSARAHAASCAAEIAQLRQSLHETAHTGAAVVGSAPQSIDAQLEHQPTPASVARAKKNANEQILALLAQAEAFDAQGHGRACRRTLRRANLLLNP